MATMNLGKVAFSWKGAWSSATTYAEQDVVSADGSTYVCIASAGSTNVDPTTVNNDWELFTSGFTGAAAGNGSIVYSDGTNLQTLAAGTAGQILTIDGATGLPIWTDAPHRSSVRVKNLPRRANASYRKAMVLMEDGFLKGWGHGGHYQLGQGANTNDKSYPTRVAFPAGFSGVKPAPPEWWKDTFYQDYAYCSMCIDNDGNLWTWGQNSYGNLGNGGTGRNDLPTNESLDANNSLYGKTVDYLAVPNGTGYSFTGTWAVCTDGTVHYCGYNGHGQSGQGNTNNTYNFVQFATLFYPQVQVVAGSINYPFAVMLDDQGVLRFIGYSGYTQNGTNTTNASIPQVINLGTNADGDPCVCAEIMEVNSRGVWIKDTLGDIYNWGHDSTNGWLGRSASGPHTVGLVMSHTTADIVEVVCNGDDAGYAMSSYMRAADGTIYSAGYNGHGQLGNGTTTARNVYAPVLNIPTNITKMIAGGSSGYPYWAALTADGKVYTLGYNGNGALANGTTSAISTPWEVPIQQTVVDIAPTGYSSEQGLLYLLEDGSLMSSGYGGNSQQPDDDAESFYVPMNVLF